MRWVLSEDFWSEPTVAALDGLEGRVEHGFCEHLSRIASGTIPEHAERRREQLRQTHGVTSGPSDKLSPKLASSAQGTTIFAG